MEINWKFKKIEENWQIFVLLKKEEWNNLSTDIKYIDVRWYNFVYDYNNRHKKITLLPVKFY